MSKSYTTQLQAGLGLIEETRKLIILWQPGMRTSELFQAALNSGDFPNVSARRLRNIVAECFAPRYLISGDYPADLLRQLMAGLSSNEWNQLLFLYTARANLILADFVKDIYWERYSSGLGNLHTEDAKAFVIAANQQGRTAKMWSESTIRRISAYLAGCCSDFGLLEPGQKSIRKMRNYRIEQTTIAFLAYDLHFRGLGDNAVMAHSDWALFGLQKQDVREELKRLSRKGYLIIQTAGDLTQISWHYKSWEELMDVILKG